MLSFLISRLVILIFGTLYPAYASYKAVKTKDIKEYVKWMMYWIVFAFFTAGEIFLDVFLSFWFPFYYELKVVFVFWLLCPATKGSNFMYRKFVHPLLSKREKDIDDYLERCKEDGYSAVLKIGSKAVTMATSTFIETAVRLHSKGLLQGLRKSYSVAYLNDENFNLDDHQNSLYERKISLSRTSLATDLPPSPIEPVFSSYRRDFGGSLEALNETSSRPRRMSTRRTEVPSPSENTHNSPNDSITANDEIVTDYIEKQLALIRNLLLHEKTENLEDNETETSDNSLFEMNGDLKIEIDKITADLLEKQLALLRKVLLRQKITLNIEDDIESSNFEINDSLHLKLEIERRPSDLFECLGEDTTKASNTINAKAIDLDGATFELLERVGKEESNVFQLNDEICINNIPLYQFMQFNNERMFKKDRKFNNDRQNEVDKPHFKIGDTDDRRDTTNEAGCTNSRDSQAICANGNEVWHTMEEIHTSNKIRDSINSISSGHRNTTSKSAVPIETVHLGSKISTEGINVVKEDIRNQNSIEKLTADGFKNVEKSPAICLEVREPVRTPMDRDDACLNNGRENLLYKVETSFDQVNTTFEDGKNYFPLVKDSVEYVNSPRVSVKDVTDLCHGAIEGQEYSGKENRLSKDSTKEIAENRLGKDSTKKEVTDKSSEGASRGEDCSNRLDKELRKNYSEKRLSHDLSNDNRRSICSTCSNSSNTDDISMDSASTFTVAVQDNTLRKGKYHKRKAPKAPSHHTNAGETEFLI